MPFPWSSSPESRLLKKLKSVFTRAAKSGQLSARELEILEVLRHDLDALKPISNAVLQPVWGLIASGADELIHEVAQQQRVAAQLKNFRQMPEEERTGNHDAILSQLTQQIQTQKSLTKANSASALVNVNLALVAERQT